MTIAEFKAWLEGFAASIDGAPDKEQWAEIKKKIVSLREPVINLPASPTPWRIEPVEPWPAPNKPWWEQPVIMRSDNVARGTC